MPLHAEIEVRPDHLRVVTTGEFELGQGVGVFAEVVRRAAEHGLDRVLVDNRQARRPLGATEKALFGASIEDRYQAYLDGGGAPLRIAFLVPEDWLMPFRPLAETLSAVGLATETFSDPKALCEWLGVDSVD